MEDCGTGKFVRSSVKVVGSCSRRLCVLMIASRNWNYMMHFRDFMMSPPTVPLETCVTHFIIRGSFNRQLENDLIHHLASCKHFTNLTDKLPTVVLCITNSFAPGVRLLCVVLYNCEQGTPHSIGTRYRFFNAMFKVIFLVITCIIMRGANADPPTLQPVAKGRGWVRCVMWYSQEPFVPF